MTNKHVIIIGNGGHAAVLTEIILQQRRTILGFTAPDKQENRFGINYIGTDDRIDCYDKDEVELVLGLGTITVSNIRENLFNQLKQKGFMFSSVIHKDAIISPYAILGEGVQVMAGAVIQTFSEVADNTIINTSSSIDHNCRIGKHCHLSPGTSLSGSVTVGDSTHIGTGSTIIQDVNIGNHVLIGAGSLVLNDIKDYSRAFGAPAKEV